VVVDELRQKGVELSSLPCVEGSEELVLRVHQQRVEYGCRWHVAS
jgi:hypothetical protein